MSAAGTKRLKLVRVELRDFRGIDSLDLDFRDAAGRPLDDVYIAGDNGCGKTAVLEAILLATGHDELLPPASTRPARNRRFGSDDFRLRAVVDDGGRPTECERSGLQDAEWRNMPLAVSLNDLARGIRTDSVPCRGEALYYVACRSDCVPYPDMETQAGRTLANTALLAELKSKLVSTYYRQLRSREPAAAGPFARIQAFWESLRGPGSVLDVIPTSNDPGSGDTVVVRTPGTVPADVTSLAMARELSPSRPDIPRMVPLDDLSSGEQALLLFAGPIVFRDRPLDLLLVDEPEQHLHVQWQTHLMAALRALAPDLQIVVATHSDDILRQALHHEIFTLVADRDPRAPNEAPLRAADSVQPP